MAGGSCPAPVPPLTVAGEVSPGGAEAGEEQQEAKGGGQHGGGGCPRGRGEPSRGAEAAAAAPGAALLSGLEPAVRQRRGLNRARGRDHSCRGGGGVGGAAPMPPPSAPV